MDGLIMQEPQMARNFESVKRLMRRLLNQQMSNPVTGSNLAAFQAISGAALGLK